MALELFSTSVLTLYESAESSDLKTFPGLAVRIVGVLLNAERSVHVPKCDWMTSRCVLCIEHWSQNGECPEPSEAHDELRSLLLSKEVAWLDGGAERQFRCRKIGTKFSEPDKVVLRAIWPHVNRSVNLNLNHALERTDPYHDRRAMALISPRGMIEVANAALNELVMLEWPLMKARSFPLPVITALLKHGRYRGRQIEISATPKFGYLACTARRVPVIATLAPSELNVADRFAKGMTHSQIAAQLRVSPHTVRNQLAQVYQKLGVHSKVDLIRIMSSR